MDAVDRRCFDGGGKPEHLRVGSFSKVIDCGKAVTADKSATSKILLLPGVFDFFFPSGVLIWDMKIAIVGQFDNATLMAS
jgi:hypothetical protein